jgi:hypothetical protein
MTDDEFKREKRRQRRLDKIGTATPRCLCGETHWACFEEHHIARRAYEPDETVFVCVSCHRKLTEDQKDRAPPPPGTEPWHARIRELLLGLADLLRLAAAKLVELADEILKAPLAAPANHHGF